MKRVSLAVRKKAARIKLVLFDVDGVLTDGGIIIDDKGVETKRFHVRDGHGIALLQRSGIEVGFITGRSSNVVRLRAKELGIRLVYQGMHNKAEAYAAIKRRTRLTDQEIAYVGDDALDLPILEQTGLAVAVQDCWPGLRERVDYVTQATGGNGAAREVSELLLKTRGEQRE
jgi:3-deoxy-D-manno-octulosonate 8-phosphate phosphatase (KDO 8-P phosphatase)